jgi:hypothetical protein
MRTYRTGRTADNRAGLIEFDVLASSMTPTARPSPTCAGRPRDPEIQEVTDLRKPRPGPSWCASWPGALDRDLDDMRAAAESKPLPRTRNIETAQTSRKPLRRTTSRSMISVVGFETPSSDIGSTGAFWQTESRGGLNTHHWVATMPPVNSSTFCLDLRRSGTARTCVGNPGEVVSAARLQTLAGRISAAEVASSEAAAKK